MDWLVFYLSGVVASLVMGVRYILRSRKQIKWTWLSASGVVAMLGVLSWFGFMMLLIVWAEDKEKESKNRKTGIDGESSLQDM
jgi:hypothetical protein